VEFGFVVHLALAAPARERQLVLGVLPGGGAELAILGLERIGRGATLRLFDRHPFVVEFDLAKLPAGKLIGWVAAERFVAEGFLSPYGDRLVLTTRGRLLADALVRDLVD